MTQDNGTRWPFIYLLVITILSVILIIFNALTGMRIPFKVDFLIGFIAALLVFVVWHAILTKGWKRSLVMFLLSFILAFTAEALGVNFGLIFGHYYYTPILGAQLFGVPFLAALAWEPILYASFTISDLLFPSLVDRTKPLLKRLPAYVWMAIAGALATTAWDTMIDPIAVSQGWWVWQDGGTYLPYINNGVPIQNFIGWLGVAFTIQVVYRIITETTPRPRRTLSLSAFGPVTLYASLFLTSIGVAITVMHRSEVALVGLMAMGPFLAISITNLNIVQRGIASLLSSGWLEIEAKAETVKTPQI
jgi:uncharacterized membrane protein